MTHPPTPSSTLSEEIFHEIRAPTEWIEDYHPGGLHPIHLHDTLHGGQYIILRKLGYGSFSTVWLARDTQESRYVAIKIGLARGAETNHELEIFNHLAPHRHQSGAQYVMELTHYFELEGPNGRHLCLVFPVMGPAAATMQERFHLRSSYRGRYPLWIAKSMLKQLLMGLSFLHRNGVMHNDIQPGNILFSLPNIDSLPESQFQTNITQPQTISDPVQRIDGKVDFWSPRYPAIPQPLESLVTFEARFTIQISDMGAAFLATTANGTPITPAALRAPELILTNSWDLSIDIWSFGCLLFEFLTGTPLLVVGGPSREDMDDDHLVQLTTLFGPLPAELRARWSRYSLNYNKHGNSINPGQPCFVMLLETYLKKEAPPEMDTGEVETVGILLREILQYNPAKRPTVADLLKNPWFEAIAEDAQENQAAEAGVKRGCNLQ